MVPKLSNIIEKAKAYLPGLNEDRVRRAYDFAEEAHKGQKRFSGDPYIEHPLEVAALLLDFHPDEDSLVAALLHDVAEDTARTLDDIEHVFGADVRALCCGLMKLSKVRSRIDDPQADNLRKLFLAMAKDFRVILIKLCDRLHNMRTLNFVRPEKRIRIAQETFNIYSPIAARLGVYGIKSELEDLSFVHLQPEDYQNIQLQFNQTVRSRDRYIEAAKRIIRDTLAKEGIQASVDGRTKSIFSIYRKLKKKNKQSISEIFDVFAMRILLPDIFKQGKEYTGHLYTALGVLHNHFTPLANRFKDYVAVPKVNGYRSLHTTVVGLGPKDHIRTESMHHAAEFGIAAHWMYEETPDDVVKAPRKRDLFRLMSLESEDQKDTGTTAFLKNQQNWISDLRTMEAEVKSNQEFLEHLRGDLFQDRIFVLTPRGDVKDLPSGATPIDFAYAVHTEIGNRFIGAKVNGNVVPVDYELKSGEVVEILIRKNAVRFG
ncbi:bifunctional (p)ppGpp synthetase/guanosine-3',5'-bis(diphosphate) 3'-pyrophosphohydrolase [Candidatus Peregrinibacteria bacterium]|nr:bifunctional (p)ppGpp synthetase/guanosine-3',5'-bis(diphosphate) 3'-pyrophosphohydrolase [Candidatus Peregrinibacteria bacterium]